MFVAAYSRDNRETGNRREVSPILKISNHCQAGGRALIPKNAFGCRIPAVFRVRSLTLKIYSRLWCSKGFVNKTDDYPDDSPLDEVSRSLHQSEFQPDVQVHVVVQHKGANHENANENAEARTFRSARSALMVHCENHGGNQVR